MSWLYSQALVAEYLADTCSDGAPFAPSNTSPTPQAYCAPDKMTAFSRPSRFGMTFAPLTDDRGAALLTWFQAGFPARTSAPPAKVPASTASDPACGGKWRELSVKYDPATSSWKTHRCLWDEDLPESSLTLPKWGSMRAGVLSERMTSALHTAETDAGLLPTPLKDDWKGGTDTPHTTTGKSRIDQFRHWCKVVHGLTYPIPEHSEAMMGWPLGWTDLKPLATAKCRNAPPQPGVSSLKTEPDHA